MLKTNKDAMQKALLLLFIIIIVTFLSCKKNEILNSEIKKTHKRAKENHRTTKDSISLYLAELLEYDTLQLSKLSRARTHHIRGLYYETQLKYDSAALAFSQGTSLLRSSNLKMSLLLRTAFMALKLQNFDGYKRSMTKAQELIKNLDTPIHKAAFSANKGEYNIEIKNYKNAIPYFLKADSFLRTNDILQSRDCYQSRLGFAYSKISKYSKAFEHLKKSITLSIRLNNNYCLERSYLYISSVYRNVQRYDQAIKWQKKQLELAYKIQDLVQVQKGLENMGQIYVENEKWAKAESYFIKALETAFEMADSSTINEALYNTGNLYYLTDDSNNARDYEYRIENFNKPQAILSSLFHLGDINLSRRNFVSGERYLKKALSLADSLNQIEWAVTTSKRLSDLYGRTNDYKKQADALQYYIEVNNQWNKQKLTSDIKKLNIKYETEQKEKTITLQNEEIKSKNQLLIISIISIFLLIVIMTTILSIRKSDYAPLRKFTNNRHLLTTKKKL